MKERMGTLGLFALAALAAPAMATMRAGAASSASLVRAEAQESVDGLIAKGRGFLAEGKAAEAQQVFEAAEKLDGGTLRTRVWTLRSWLSQGRVNDALNEIDKLDHAGQKGPEMDYLYGMAFAFKAKGYMAERTPGSVIGMAFDDAVAFLGKATKADPVRFSDAFLPLAESAWYAHDLPVARAAADKAVSIAPQDADAYAMLGQVALAQFRMVNEDETKKSEADAEWETARAANAKVLELLAARGTSEAKARMAAAHVELARCFGWKRKTEEVQREYTAAVTADAGAVDFAEVQSLLGSSGLLAVLEAGEKAFMEAKGAQDKGDAALLWWLGFARFGEKKYGEAEAAFVASVTKQPEFWNSWYYIALARYHQQKFEESIAAFKKNFAENPSDLVSSIEAGRDTSVPILDYLIGWCAGKGKNLDAASLTEIQLAVESQNSLYWNNLGLFYRDAGDELNKSRKAEDKPKARELWEKSLVAYERAVTLSPEDPNFLNDLAVVLDYNLNRDLDRAKALYEKALVRANEELKRTDLSPGDRELRKTAAHDSKDNLEKLMRRMEKPKDNAGKKEGEKKDGPQ